MIFYMTNNFDSTNHAIVELSDQIREASGYDFFTLRVLIDLGRLILSITNF